MNKFYLTGALLASSLAVTACNKAATTTTNAAPAAANSAAPAAPAAPAGGNSAAPAAPAAPAQQAGPGQAQQNFSVLNNTGHTVVTLNVSPNNSSNWGPDILGSQVLQNGQTAQVSFPRDTAQCSWDLKATYDDGTSTDMRAIDLCTVATVTLTAG